MFEAKLLEGNILKKIVEAIKDIVTDVNIDVSPAGLSLQAMDGSHVALVSLNLSMEGFEHYRADTTMVLGINVGMLAKVMKLADPTDSITLQAEDSATHLKLIFENAKQERTTEFTLNLISLDVEHLAIPETEYSSKVSINASEFSKLCKELYTLNETMTITTHPDYCLFSVDSEAGSGSIKLGKNENGSSDDRLQLEVNEGVTQQFAIRYLNMFNKAAPLTSHTNLCLHAEQPLVVEYRIENLGVLKYYLAPKISDEQ